jgi:sn-glycerol 3-phosphate transport system substrate-binding protein
MTNISRRDFLKTAAFTTAATFATGIAGSSIASAATTTKKKPTNKKNKFNGLKPGSEIVYWSAHPAKSKPVEEELIKRFNAANPDIKVLLQTAGANYAEIAQKLNAGIAARSIPDVVMLSDVWWFKYYLNRTLTPLDDLFANEKVDVADYNKTLLGDYQYDGKQWAVPFARSTPLFYFNKTLWAAAGLPDRAPETWAEFETWTPKLQEAIGSGKYPFTLVKGDSYIAWTFQNLLWGQGGAYSTSDFKLNLDTSEAIAAGQFLREQVSVKKYANVTSNSETDDFLGGLCASIVSSTGGLAGVLNGAKGKFEVGTGFLPKGSKPGAVCPTGGAGLAIPALVPDERKVAAMRFLNFMTSAESTAYYSANVGYMPVRTSAVEGPVMTQVYKDKPQFRTAVDQLPKTRSQDSARVWVPGGDAILGKALEAMVLSNADPKAAWATAASQLQKIIDNDVKPGL